MPLSREDIINFGKQYGYNGDYIYLRHSDVARVVDNLVIKNKLKKIINIGCGLGILEQFIKSDVDLLGIDIDKNEIALAQELSLKNKKKYQYKVASVYDFFPNNNFDLVIASEVIEHLDSDVKALKHLYDYLPKGGFLVLTVPNKWQLRNCFRRLFGLPLVLMDKTHKIEYGFRQIEKLCNEVDFEVVNRVSSVMYFPFESVVKRFVRVDGWLRRWLVKIFPKFGSHFILVLKK